MCERGKSNFDAEIAEVDGCDASPRFPKGISPRLATVRMRRVKRTSGAT